jgi:hypothetical protein
MLALVRLALRFCAVQGGRRAGCVFSSRGCRSGAAGVVSVVAGEAEAAALELDDPALGVGLSRSGEADTSIAWGLATLSPRDAALRNAKPTRGIR